MIAVSSRSPANIAAELHDKEWSEYTEAAWGHEIPVADLRYASEFIYLADKYSGRETRNILEWGTGFTTRWLCALAEKRKAELFVALDTNAGYLEQVIAFMPEIPYRFEAHAIQEVGESDDHSRSQKFNYPTFPFSFETRFDLIFIDGRRRNECLLAAAILQSDHGYVLVHDYRRKRYQLGMSLFDVVEDFFGFRVLKRKPALDAFAAEQFANLSRDASGFEGAISTLALE